MFAKTADFAKIGHMKITTIAFTVFMTLILAPQFGATADFEKGLKAAQKGDYRTAIREWEPLAEDGSAIAQSNLGLVYRLGQSVDKNIVTAIKWYTLAAEQGYAEAQSSLGLMYLNGEGVLRDFQKALKWYTLAAEQGDADAQYNVGTMYDKGSVSYTHLTLPTKRIV